MISLRGGGRGLDIFEGGGLEGLISLRGVRGLDISERGVRELDISERGIRELDISEGGGGG